MRCIAVISLLVATMSAQNAPSTNKGRHLDIPAISREARGAVVSIVMADKSGQPIAQGSGFVVSRDGQIVTNYHVIKTGASAVVKLPDGSFFNVDGVLAFDKKRDIAVIKAHGNNFKTVVLGDSSQLQIGEEVVAIGSPLSLESTVSNGILSGIRSEGEDAFGPTNQFLQITAPISHGSSGGPLFNMFGQVVGITSAALVGGENLNFAIPINDVKPRLKSGSELRPFPNEPEEAENTPAPAQNPTKLTYSKQVDAEGKSHYAFHANCSVVGNSDGCSIFNELAGNDESDLFHGLIAMDESLVCFDSPDSRNSPHYRANTFSVFGLSTHIAKDPDDLDAYSITTYYNNGVLANYIQQFYLIPSPFGEGYTVMETGLPIPPLQKVQGSLTTDEFTYHELFQRGQFEDWNYNSWDVSLLTGRMTIRVSGDTVFGRCFSYTRPQWAEKKTDSEEAAERQQYAAKVQARVKAREDAARAEAQKENDCVFNAYRPYCARCSQKELEQFVFDGLVAHDARFVSIADKCRSTR
jgi:Trypsin-like peptidase domain